MDGWSGSKNLFGARGEREEEAVLKVRGRLHDITDIAMVVELGCWVCVMEGVLFN